MTPVEIIRREKRRYEDDPAYTIFRWLYGMVKLAAGALLVMSLGTMGKIYIIVKSYDANCTTVKEHDKMLLNHEIRITDCEKKSFEMEQLHPRSRR